MKRALTLSISIVLLSLAACSPIGHPSEVALSFRYVELKYDNTKETGYYFVEDPMYPDLIETVTFDYGHIITQEDIDDINFATRSVPHGLSGYYWREGYYLDMENPSDSRRLTECYECLADATFYYSYLGGSDTGPETISLVFRYAAIRFNQFTETGFAFVEDPEYPDLTETFTYPFEHIITQAEYDEVMAAVSQVIPHDNGGDYTFYGFYTGKDLPSPSSMFTVGYECVPEYTFYYSWYSETASTSSATLATI